MKAKRKLSIDNFKEVNINAAGIDIGARTLYVAVPEGRDSEPVRRFGAFTEDLKKIGTWLKERNIDTVAMESTGIYWVPIYEYLESQGIDVALVDARAVKNVSGRKTDVCDAQWIQQLHTFGLLQPAFRPDEGIKILRDYLRQRKNLVQQASKEIQHMQKAMSQMNIKLRNVVREVTGVTGLKIIKDIVSGIHDPTILAKHRDHRCRRSIKEIELSLMGSYRDEHLFALKQSLEAYEFYQKLINECEGKIKEYLKKLKPSKSSEYDRGNSDEDTSMSELLKEVVGVDLTKIEGVNENVALTVISEVGLDMSKFKTEKQFCSWLRLCPVNKISGDKVLSSRTKKTTNRAAEMLRIAARSLHSSNNALGAFFRRIKARRGAPKAITATAHKIAKYIYHMLKNGEEYGSADVDAYEQQYRERMITNMQRKARALGMQLVPAA